MIAQKAEIYYGNCGGTQNSQNTCKIFQPKKISKNSQNVQIYGCFGLHKMAKLLFSKNLQNTKINHGNELHTKWPRHL